MFQIAIVSGKGGTGKTTISGSLAVLFEKHALVDCDVDAPNLHLLFDTTEKDRYEYYGSKKAVIDYDKCDNCGVCANVCRFYAVYFDKGRYLIDEYACEGCNACVISCPRNAISLVDSKSGDYFHSIISNLPSTPLIHAELKPGEESSGGLVAEVRKLALKVATDEKKEKILIDGAPGVGCPAISSIAGVDYVLVVAEPTMSGYHDMIRMVETAKKLRRRVGIVVNKYDLNETISKKMEDYCQENNVDFLGFIPFDVKVKDAIMRGVPVVKYEPDSPASRSILELFEKLRKLMEDELK